MMRLDEFSRLTEEEILPFNLPAALKALWYVKKGDWTKAHQIVQNASDVESAWVHAYLHRVEGDLNNAHYWYRRTGRPADFQVSLDHEWEQIVKDLLGKT